MGWNGKTALPLFIVDITFPTLAAAALGLRIWARRIKKTSFSLNDYFVIAGFFFTVVLAVAEIFGVIMGGVGMHQADVGAEASVILSKVFVTCEMSWVTANTLVKLSILHLYVSVFRQRTFRLVAYGVATFATCYFLATISVYFTICRPFAYTWDRSIPGGVCGDDVAVYYSTGIINLILDVTIVVMPWPMLWGLQLSMRKKISLTAVFGLGAFICLITILRMISIYQINLSDFPYSVQLFAIWSMLEPTLGILSACLPVMQPALAQLFSTDLLAWSRNGRSTHSTQPWSKNGKSQHTTQTKKSWAKGPSNGAVEPHSQDFERLYDSSYQLGGMNGNSSRVTAPLRAQVPTRESDLEPDLESQRIQRKTSIRVTEHRTRQPGDAATRHNLLF